MLSKQNILKFEKRKKIYDFISENPGFHLRELSRNMDISFGSLRHHLYFLEKQGLITTKIDGRYTRYYITQTMGRKEKEILNLLRQETPLRIIMLLITPGPGKIFKNKKTQDKALSNPSSYHKTYSKSELINLTRYWDGPYSKFFHLKKHPTTLNFHLKKMLEIDLIEKIKVGKKNKYRLKDEDMIWAFFIKYNDALSIRSIDLYLLWRETAMKEVGDKMINVMYEVFPHPYHA